MLVAGLLLSRWLRRRAPAEQHIGLLLPASIGGALANIGTTLAGKVPVNLNFTAGREAMAAAIERCGDPDDHHVADVPDEGVHRAAGRHGVPRRRDEGVRRRREDRHARDGLRAAGVGHLALARAALPPRTTLATVIFSSGSTGIPKGVMLSHRNILSNIDAIGQVFDITSKDVLIGVLPFFHSFGFTGDAVVPDGRRLRRRLPPQPDGREDHRRAGRDSRRDDPDRHADVLLGVHPQVRAATVRARCGTPIVGAERLREPVAQAFEEKFGIRLLEGYGCAWIDFFRAIPPLVLLIFIYAGLPFVGFRPSPMTAVAIAFFLNTSSYYGEIYRAGIESVVLANGMRRGRPAFAATRR